MHRFQETAKQPTESSPSVVAVCLSVQEMENSQQKVYAVLAPKCKKSEVEEEYGSKVEDFNAYVKKNDEFFYCAHNKLEQEQKKEHLSFRPKNVIT